MSLATRLRRLARGAGDERGAGTVVVLALVAVVVVLALGVAALAGAVTTRAAAQSAADLSALAAAAAAQQGEVDPCTRAQQVVERNEARLVGCSCAADLSCTVETATTTRAGRVATAEARAGPRSLAVPG